MQKIKIYESIWYWWLILTAIYILLNIAGYPSSVDGASGSIPIILYVSGFIGLFVPYGLMSLYLFILPTFPFSLASLVAFVFSMKFADKRIQNLNVSTFKKILICILLLSIITMIVDLVRFTPFASFEVFFNVRS